MGRITEEQWATLEMPAGEDTFPKLIRRNYLNWGDKRVAYRYKDFGYWREINWKDFYERVKWLAGGFIRLGFKYGDRVAIVGENAPEWFWGQFAAQCLGGASVGLYVDSTPSELQYIIDHSDAKIVIAHDQEQVDKILSIREQIPKVNKVIYWEAKGMWYYEDPWLIGFDDVMELGREYERQHPSFFEESIDKTKPDDVAVLLYTSGTTGLPKGSMVTYKNLLSLFKGWDSCLPWKESDENVSFLPPAWIGEQIFSVAPNLVKGIRVNFVESPETVQRDIREVGPQVLLFSSRQWEMYCSTIQAKMIDSSAMKKFFYNLFLPVGHRIADSEEKGEKISPFWRMLNKLGYLIVFRPLQDKVGLLKTRLPISAGAALSPYNFRFLRAIGIPIVQGYGTTEVSGLDVVQQEGIFYKYEGSGQPFVGVEIRVTDEGEILLGGVGRVQGYYKQPEETAKSFKEGYFYTGDGGFLDEDGELYIYDRVKDMRTLRTGEKYSPTYIEGRLKFSPYIKDVMVVGGEEHDYVTAIVDMDYENTGRWAEINHVPYTSHPDLSQKPAVIELLSKDVDRVNRVLPDSIKVRRFLVLYKNFDPDEGELTRTRKLRRGFMEERYRKLIDAMYAGNESTEVESTITYRDGRQSIMRIPIRIKTM